MKLVRRIVVVAGLLATGVVAGYVARPVIADSQPAMTKAAVEREVARQVRAHDVDCSPQDWPVGSWSCSDPTRAVVNRRNEYVVPPDEYDVTVVGRHVNVKRA